MAESDRLAIAHSIQAALQAMTVASGYHWDVQAASVTLDPVVLETIPTRQLPAFYVHPDVPGDRTFFPANRVRDRYNFTVVGCADAPQSLLTDRKMTVFEALAADLEKALTVDITRGGHAIDTRLGHPDAPMMGLGTNNRVVIVQPIIVVSRHVYGQP